MKRHLIVYFCMLLLGLAAEAKDYTVKADGGGNFNTIEDCAKTVAAGDTCDVYTGNYSGWTQSTNGSAGNLITFQCHKEETCNITSRVILTNSSYIRLTGFTFPYFPGHQILAHGGASFVQVDHNTFNDIVVFDDSGTEPVAQLSNNNNIFSNNVIHMPGATSPVDPPSLQFYGDYDLVENNEFSGGSNDCTNIYGKFVVVRSNLCHDKNGHYDVLGQDGIRHIDFLQVSTYSYASYLLVENNRELNCTDDGENCHFVFVRQKNTSGLVDDTIIARFNYAYNMDSGFMGIGAAQDPANSVVNAEIYNNTAAVFATRFTSSGGCVTISNGSGQSLNNICYDTNIPPYSPFYLLPSATGNGDMAITPKYGESTSWNTYYSSEPTYYMLRNLDPQFVDVTVDGTLSSKSPAVGAGVALTTVAAGGCSGRTINLTNPHVFQDGWGPVNNPVEPDTIRVGTSTVAQFALRGINYSTGAAGLTSSVTCSPGDPVYLFRDSNGETVLFGNSPDVGARPVGQQQPAPPGDLSVTVN